MRESVCSRLAGSSCGFADAAGASAGIYDPRGVSVSPGGQWALVADANNHRIRKVVGATGAVSTLAGSSYGFADATGASAKP